MVKKFNPILEIEKFKKIPTTEWQGKFAKYSRADIEAILGTIMVTDFFLRDALTELAITR